MFGMLDIKLMYTKFVITIEDGTEIGGLGSSIKEIIVNKNIEGVKIKCFAYPDEFIKHGSVPELEELYGVDCENIVRYIKNNFDFLRNNIEI